LVDNAIVLLISGATAAPIDSALFWGSLVMALSSPVLPPTRNRWLIARGRGHAMIHRHH